MIVNLFDETEKALNNHKLSLRNAKFVCSRGGQISIANFTSQAKNFTYDNESGRIMLDPYLKIVGVAWWMERFVYNGREGWYFCKKPWTPKVIDYGWIVSNPGGLESRWWETKIES